MLGIERLQKGGNSMISQYFNIIYGSTLVLFGIVLLVYSGIRSHQYLRAKKQEDYRQENNMDFIGYGPINAEYDPVGLIKMSFFGFVFLLAGGYYLIHVLGVLF
jgi:hypothetical protein